MRIFELLKNIFFALILLQIAPSLIKNVIKTYSNILEPKARVAIIPIQNELRDAAPIVKQLKTYFEDPLIKAIALKIDCPGSTTGTGQAIHDEIAHLKACHPKPIISLVENTCASGAYLIACATDHIVAPGMSIIGSIGVKFSNIFQLQRLIEKYDVGSVSISSSPYKTAGDLFTNMTPEQKEMLQKIVDDSYEQFTLTVAHDRKLSIITIKDWADGKIFTGKQALALGLIDTLGSSSIATEIIKEKAMIEKGTEIEWVKKEKPLSLITRLISDQEDTGDGPLLETIINTICSVVETRASIPRL